MMSVIKEAQRSIYRSNPFLVRLLLEKHRRMTGVRVDEVDEKFIDSLFEPHFVRMGIGI